VVKLLSIGSNAKTIKSDAGGEYLTAILYLAPHTEAGGKSLCPSSTTGCRDGCLYTAGRGVQRTVQEARVRKAQWFLEDPLAFYHQLVKELIAFEKRCKKLNVKPAVRLNGTSDILWETWGKKFVGFAMLPSFPNIQLYDYTKISNRMFSKDLPDNYQLTFSADESTKGTFIQALAKDKRNTAVVFRGPELPCTYLGIPVINGDLHDLRFTDPKGVIVGLLAKGPAKNDTSGFVVDI
jgi:hypothetical protein